MSAQPENSWQISRRSFLKWSGALAGAAAATGAGMGLAPFRSAEAATGPHTVVRNTTCSNNCGGRCVLRAHITDGVITRIESDPDPDLPGSPQLRACQRGLSYRQIAYHPDRLKYPMKRVGKRGEGKFARISWDEATSTVADQIRRISAKYGALSIYPNYAWGTSGLNRGPVWANRLLGIYCGDFLNHYGTYSSGQTNYATPLTYGTVFTGNHRSDLANSKLIILLGWNPAETVFGVNTMHYLRKAKEAGARVILIDPRYTDTAVAVADEWIPIRPTTDSALLDAMAYVAITGGLQDQKFLDRFCLGFDEEHMPEGIPSGASFKSHILGLSDGHPKTPEWAAAITGIPAERIALLGRQYATSKPAALIQGFGPQRHANGEQSVRSATVLAALTGNVGVKGGFASGAGYPNNPVPTRAVPQPGGKVQISVFLWTEAILRGKELTREKDLIQGADRLPSNIKMILNLGGNALINQHSDINRTRKILQDESLCEFIVASDIFMTASTRFADLLLPAAGQFERENVLPPWSAGDYLLYGGRIIEPPGEALDEYDWLSAVADKLGVKEKFTEGRTIADWMRFCTEPAAQAFPAFDFDEFRKGGVFKVPVPAGTVAFAKQIADPDKNKFPTPSGKIEIFSQRLWDRKDPVQVPAVPKYVPAIRGPSDPLALQYPLQMTGFHIKRRVHSIHDNNPWMAETAQQEVWIHPFDAEPRGISDGDRVSIFNDLGSTRIPAKVTQRIMPGVVAVPQGAWYAPGPNGSDTNGSINVLTTQRGSYMGNCNPQHTNLVEIRKG